MGTSFRNDILLNEPVDHGAVHAPSAEQVIQVPLGRKAVVNLSGQLIKRLLAGDDEIGDFTGGGGKVIRQHGGIRFQEYGCVQVYMLSFPAEDAAPDHAVDIITAELVGQAFI